MALKNFSAQHILFKGLLLPFSIVYGIAISIRNSLYSTGLLKSVAFNIPVIGIGNLCVGGAGKTPHVEYFIRLLSPYLNIGVLSRGYNRNSKGFRLVASRDNARTVGDEPMQYFYKFKPISVAVSESRSLGIPLMLGRKPEINLILLDDSYQHRSVTPYINILLTAYDDLFTNDFILPAGRLREWPSASSRADIIIVSKCPEDLSNDSAEDIKTKIQVKDQQKIFFSYYRYGNPYNLNTGVFTNLSSFEEVVLICAIASEEYLLSYLVNNVQVVHTMIFEDHHYFSHTELNELKKLYSSVENSRKAILTTEKDATRLVLQRQELNNLGIEIYVLPIFVEFLFNKGAELNDLIRNDLLSFKV